MVWSGANFRGCDWLTYRTNGLSNVRLTLMLSAVVNSEVICNMLISNDKWDL